MLRTLGLLALVGGTTGLVVPPALAPRALGAAASPVHRIGTSPAMQKEDGVRAGLVTEVPFEVRFSIGNAISISGAVLLLYCLLSFLFSNGQADLLQTLGFVYAIPALVGGLALKYAELPPVPLSQVGATAKEMEALRESKATKIQKKILSDATRFTYGDVSIRSRCCPRWSFSLMLHVLRKPAHIHPSLGPCSCTLTPPALAGWLAHPRPTWRSPFAPSSLHRVVWARPSSSRSRSPRRLLVATLCP
mmetsp:Transcript_24248/g.66859  ORF Transcript_24248/g.66859 Transcript_24248/m.66859 type:complete len:248 (-) Transcript_24248:780-1523(-)